MGYYRSQCTSSTDAIYTRNPLIHAHKLACLNGVNTIKHIYNESAKLNENYCVAFDTNVLSSVAWIVPVIGMDGTVIRTTFAPNEIIWLRT